MGRAVNDETAVAVTPREPVQPVYDPEALDFEPGSLLVLCAPPAAGKSSFIKRYYAGREDVIVVSSDEERASAFNSAGEWDQSVSGAAFKNAYQRVRTALAEGKLVVFDSTASAAGDRTRLRNLAAECHAQVHFLGFDCPIELCRQRNALRGLADPMREVPEEALQHHHNLASQALTSAADEGFASVTVLSQNGQERLLADKAPLTVADGDLRVPAEQVAQVEGWLRASDPVAAVRAAVANGSVAELLPEVAATIGFDQKSPYHDLELFEHLMAVLDYMSSKTDDPDLRLVALLHDIGKPDSCWYDENDIGRYYVNPELGKEDHAVIGARMAEQICRRFALDPARTRRVVTLIRHHMFSRFQTPEAALKLERRVGAGLFEDLMLFREADHAGKPDAVTHTEEMRELLRRGKEETERQALPKVKLCLSGGELIEKLNLERGPVVGRVVQALSEAVGRNPELNEPERLLDYARTLELV